MPAAPALNVSNVQKAIRPSAVTPLWTSITAAGRTYAHVNSSARVQHTFTGRPTARARAPAAGGRRVSGGSIAGGLPAVRRPGIGHDDAHLLDRHVKRLGELAAHAER